FSSKNGNELSESIFSVIEWLGGRNRGKEILFIGNSTINRTIISHFTLKRQDHLTLCTRVKEQQQGSLRVVGWEELENLERYEAVISGAHHHEYILKAEHFTDKKKDSSHSLSLFDLSVPRTIDPMVRTFPSISLFNIDQLGDLIKRKQRKSAKEIDLCEHMLEQSIERQAELYLKRRESKWQNGPLWQHFKVAT
ncbi:MAG: hypothetical protein HYZ47_02025, partial [Simkania negevensis]|nr:hypothetical protein [Simkania negevensis]